MKSTIQIISELEQMERVQWGHYSAPKLCTKDARDKLEELQFLLNATEQHRNDWADECRKARDEVKLLKQHLADRLSPVRPEPSRLEIAAMLLTAPYCDDVDDALEWADALIAAAKEAK